MENLSGNLIELPKNSTSRGTNRDQYTTNQIKATHTCLCCSDILIRHIRCGEIYWRCSRCRQAIPVL